jgi:serpin B
MKKKIRSWAVLMILFLVLVFGPQISSSLSKSADEKMPAFSNLVSANTAFGFKLFHKIMEQQSEDNVFLSPLSIAAALAMTYNGAADKTQEAMARALELQDMDLEQLNQAYSELTEALMSSESGVHLKIANSIWADMRFKFDPDFIKNNKEFYSASVKNLDLSDPQSLELINQWAEEETEGRISKIVSEDDLDALIFLIDAVYFKGMWTIGFKEEDTKESDFKSADGTLKKVPMMLSQSDQYLYYKGEGFQAAALPYGEGKSSLYLFLPDEGSNLKEFQMKLSRESWDSWMSGFKKELVSVSLPRLKLKSEVFLNDALRALGMAIAFTPAANFTRMCSGPAFIDYVKHMSFAEVNEEGTEASAVTVVKMKRGTRHVLRFDRPFFLAIRDNETGSILFMGSIINP